MWGWCKCFVRFCNMSTSRYLLRGPTRQNNSHLLGDIRFCRVQYFLAHPTLHQAYVCSGAKRLQSIGKSPCLLPSKYRINWCPSMSRIKHLGMFVIKRGSQISSILQYNVADTVGSVSNTVGKLGSFAAWIEPLTTESLCRPPTSKNAKSQGGQKTNIWWQYSCVS
jgi:hypothetical protein